MVAEIIDVLTVAVYGVINAFTSAVADAFSTLRQFKDFIRFHELH